MSTPLSEKRDDKLMQCDNCGHKYCTYEEIYYNQSDVREAIKELIEYQKLKLRLCNESKLDLDTKETQTMCLYDELIKIKEIFGEELCG